ncbi:uncharacterized protein LOC134278764 [Saccostrea cucullata]|uniref:uncharacterized protein LOC134278764 n=1 Tax=Saccostrea cuccullata TaxID=36930 RepID=UPI002ED28E2C
MQHLSESVYLGLCHKVGTSRVVVMRRDVIDIVEIVNNQVYRDFHKMLSGSQREGFKLKGADFDTMIWRKEDKVIWNLSQTRHYQEVKNVEGVVVKLILADVSHSPPGFTLLQALIPRVNTIICIPEAVFMALVFMNGRYYISSTKYRQYSSCLDSINARASFMHGPCVSGVLFDGEEYDHAHCFACDFWPPSASSWIDRCHSWPQPAVVYDVVKSGCHIVPIGHKLGNHPDEEWRISFSLAEQKLVYTMNHCQLLVYGLLKISLKEIFHEILGESSKLLCSYHMKTAVFWVLQQNIVPYWHPKNLLECFWVCFKLILKWVHEGVCPNFFIPDNNMFLHNIYGEVQKNLFNELYTLYQRGISFLLFSSSIKPYLVNVLQSPRLNICTDECTIISELDFDLKLFVEIREKVSLPLIDFNGCMKVLHMIEQHNFNGSSLSQYQFFTLQKLKVLALQITTFILHMYINFSSINKFKYSADKLALYMLKLAAKTGCISDLLYLGIYYYKTFRFKEALSVIKMTKGKIAQPYLMYKIYTEAVGEQAWSSKMREDLAVNIRLFNEICYINELLPEQRSGLLNESAGLVIDTRTFSHMLEFLCYCNTDPIKAKSALDHLQNIVYKYQGFNHEEMMDINWQILGICQQMAGDLQAALYSYQQSLQYKFHGIQTATLMRIKSLHCEGGL